MQVPSHHIVGRWRGFLKDHGIQTDPKKQTHQHCCDLLHPTSTFYGGHFPVHTELVSFPKVSKPPKIGIWQKKNPKQSWNQAEMKRLPLFFLDEVTTVNQPSGFLQGETEDPEGAFRDRWGVLRYYYRKSGKNLFFFPQWWQGCHDCSDSGLWRWQGLDATSGVRIGRSRAIIGANLHPLVYDLLCFQWFELHGVGLSLKGSYNYFEIGKASTLGWRICSCYNPRPPACFPKALWPKRRWRRRVLQWPRCWRHRSSRKRKFFASPGSRRGCNTGWEDAML